MRPSRPSKGGIITGDYNFQVLNTFMPHPIYGWMGWIAIINPDRDIFAKCQEYLDIAYEKALKNTMKKLQLISILNKVISLAELNSEGVSAMRAVNNVMVSLLIKLSLL